MSRAACLLGLGLVLACGEPDEPAPPGATGGGVGEGGSGGEPTGAWGPSWACEPGSVTLPNARCEPAGIPPELCGPYFEPDGDGSCVAILPEEACAPGEMAVPGDTSCAPVAPCNADPWADVPWDATTEFVDASYVAGDSDGTMAKPWPSIQAGVDAAIDGAIVAVVAGTYLEAVSVSGKAVHIVGACPAAVRLESVDSAALSLMDASGTEIERLTLVGEPAIDVLSSEDVVIQRARFTQGNGGVHLEGDSGPVSARVTRCLFESVGGGSAIASRGAPLVLAESEVRGSAGRAIFVTDIFTDLAHVPLDFDRVLVRDITGTGIWASGVILSLRDVVIQDVKDPGASWAMQVYATILDEPSEVVLERMVAERLNHGVQIVGSHLDASVLAVRHVEDVNSLGGYALEVTGLVGPVAASARWLAIDDVMTAGITLHGATAILEGVRIRGVRPATPEDPSSGIEVGNDDVTLVGGQADLHGVVIEEVEGLGVHALGTVVDITSAAIRDMSPHDGAYGRCINYESYVEALSLTEFTATGTIRDVLVERCHEAGISLSGAEVTIDNSEVRDVVGGEVRYGAGIYAQLERYTQHPTQAIVHALAVSGVEGFGLLSLASTLEVTNTAVRATRADPSRGFGDGIALASGVVSGLPVTASLFLGQSLIEDSERAGLASFGGAAVLDEATFECNTLHLNGEIYRDLPAGFEAQLPSSCGCDGVEVVCKVLSENLEAPQPSSM